MANKQKKYVIDCPELMLEWDYKKNIEIGLDPNVIAHRSSKKAWWKCSICSAEWMATIDNRFNGAGCPECAKNKRKESYKKTILQNRLCFAEQYEDLLKEWDYEKNNISPFEVTSGSKRKVWWKCAFGHSWQDSIVHRTVDKRGCPICSSESKTSFPEQAIYFYFKQVTNAQNRKLISGKEIDIYLNDLRVGIEYNGSYWHGGNSDNDLKKINFFKNIGIRILTVTDGQCNKIDGDSIVHNNDLHFAIVSLFGILNIEPPVVNINQDRSKIYEQYVKLKKENSLAVKYPNIAAEWNPTKNENLTPEMFDYSSNKLVWWKCSVCGYEWEDTINHRTAKNRCKCTKCRNAEYGLKKRGRGNPMAKEVVQCSINDDVIKIWGCATDVERALNIPHNSISRCCIGKNNYKITGGYKWYYLYDQINNNTIISGAITLGIVKEQHIKEYIISIKDGDKIAI